MLARVFEVVGFLVLGASLAGAFEPREMVVARRDVPILDSGKQVDQIGPGQVLTVLETEAAKIRVSRGRPGWIDAADALHLRDAESFFSKPFATGAMARDYLSRGTVRMALGKHEEGIADLKKAVEIANEPDNYLESLGYAQLAAQQKSSAIETFTRAIGDQADSAPALMGRGLAYYQVGQNRNAYRDLSEAIELQPQHAFPRKYIGALLHDLGKLDLARTQLKVAVNLDPFDVFIRKALGRLMFDQGDYGSALGEFDAAVKLDEKDIEAIGGRGVVRHAIGDDLISAEADFTSAIKLVEHPQDHAYLWSNIGQVQTELGKFTEAKRSLDKAIELDPQFNEARSHRSYLLATHTADKASIAMAKADMKAVFASSEAKTFWDYRALAAVNAAMCDYGRAAKHLAIGESILQKTAPARFAEPTIAARRTYENER